MGLAITEKDIKLVHFSDSPYLISLEGLRKIGFRNELRYMALNKNIPNNYRLNQYKYDISF